MDNDLLGPHADLTRVYERTEHTLLSRDVEISIFGYDGRCLSTQFQENRFKVGTGQLGDDSAHRGAACEVDLLDGWALHQGSGHRRGVIPVASDVVEDASGKASALEHSDHS